MLVDLEISPCLLWKLAASGLINPLLLALYQIPAMDLGCLSMNEPTWGGIFRTGVTAKSALVTLLLRPSLSPRAAKQTNPNVPLPTSQLRVELGGLLKYSILDERSDDVSKVKAAVSGR